MSNVFSLHSQKRPISHLVRIGHTGHKILENLHTAGRAPISHAALDAGHSLSPISNVNLVKKAG